MWPKCVCVEIYSQYTQRDGIKQIYTHTNTRIHTHVLEVIKTSLFRLEVKTVWWEGAEQATESHENKHTNKSLAYRPMCANNGSSRGDQFVSECDERRSTLYIFIAVRCIIKPWTLADRPLIRVFQLKMPRRHAVSAVEVARSRFTGFSITITMNKLRYYNITSCYYYTFQWCI